MTASVDTFARPMGRSKAPAAGVLDAVFAGVAFLALIMGVINYSGCWFWPTDGLSDFFSVKAVGGGPFRMVLWGLISASLVGVMIRSNRSAFLSAMLPYLGLFFAALVATVQGDDPQGSIWFLTLWGLMIAAGAAIGVLLTPSRINLASAVVFGAVPLISFVLLVVHPAWALMHFGGKFAVRGLFMHKNTAGAFAAYGCLLLLGFRTSLNRAWVYAALALSLALLLATLSATAVGGFTIAVLALAGIGKLRTLSGPMPIKLAILLISLLLGLAVVEWMFPLIVGALGKTQSLTGRASGWQYYWRFFQGHLIFGRGPGAFVTGSSEINEMISRLLVGDVNKSTHNAYLAILGEVGIVGLTLYVFGLLYIIFIAPLRPRSNVADLVAAAIGVYVLASGFTEAKETLSPGVGTFLILICRGAAEAQRWQPRARLIRRPVPASPSFRRLRYTGARGASRVVSGAERVAPVNAETAAPTPG